MYTHSQREVSVFITMLDTDHMYSAHVLRTTVRVENLPLPVGWLVGWSDDETQHVDVMWAW